MNNLSNLMNIIIIIYLKYMGICFGVKKNDRYAII